MENLIKKHFKRNERIEITEIIEFIKKNSKEFGFYIQELVEDYEYKTVAIAPVIHNGVKYGVIFEWEGFFLAKKYRQEEVKEIIENIMEKRRNIPSFR